jgi:hypothetical protein
MNKPVLFFAFAFYTGAGIFAQDTIRIEPPHHYSSAEYPHRGMQFASMVKYAREDIIISPTHKRIEYCFYYDKDRSCYSSDYQLTSDSTLHIYTGNEKWENENWVYKKQNDSSYQVYRRENDIYETGIVKQLIPFERVGHFITMNKNRTDTLWVADYKNTRVQSMFISPVFSLTETKISEKVFEMNEVTVLPKLLNGNPIQLTGNIGAIYPGYCYNEPLRRVRTISFIVTKNGDIKNIRNMWGKRIHVDLSCPYYFLKYMVKVSALGKLVPAVKNGKKVNCRYSINIKEER